MIVKDLGCLLVNNNRSRAYLQKLIENSFVPAYVVYFDRQKTSKKKESQSDLDHLSKLIVSAFKNRKYFLYDPEHKNNAIVTDNYSTPEKYATFNVDETIIETLEKNNIEYIVVKTANINDKEVIVALKNSPPKYFVFGGGGILRKEILNIGKKFIHIHPGMVPYYKGSYCIEWSTLCGARCAASAFYMVEKIDEGDIIAQWEFEYPELENNNIAPLYSSNIRSELLIEVIRGYVEKEEFVTIKQDPLAGETYYKMHPALMNLVLHILG
jgi:methionyl-tRNA formyltransferase